MSKEDLIKQIEYYLSNENLQNDEFFYKEVASNKDRYVSIKCFLNCNKVKKLGYTKVEQIVDALLQCEGLQLNEEHTMLRKVDPFDLPEFKPKKKVKSEEKQQQANPYDKLEVVILGLTIDTEQVVPFRYIQEALLKKHQIFSPYVRFNKTEGNIAIDKKVFKEELIQPLLKEGLKVGDTVLKITLLEGDALKQFWANHGHHFKGIIDNLKRDFSKRSREEKRSLSKNKKSVKFNFAGEEYDDINKLKSLFKNILCRNANKVPLKEKETALVKELLQHHDKKEAKLKGFKNFIVDVHPQHLQTRCVFIVKEDGTKEDFSIVKCIKNLEDKLQGN